ncbi:hypothetical protein KKY_453 [Pelagibacterium halotolerans B2]|uniref:Uncharacterized protein n=1 Tax=Pelagibacterium halotolerans (strain DSM 22347 / JCM 15775 / CGMCC 1.7692 / B2) TaxID=1082931 RepID=G4RAD5_PELHB|nr:hypothetical protein KKY_453 [Pelagibacterium halotolerans B2]
MPHALQQEPPSPLWGEGTGVRGWPRAQALILGSPSSMRRRPGSV